MVNPQKKLRSMLSLACSMIAFGIALTMIVLDVAVSAKIAGLIAAFLSGWGCCYSLGRMSGCIEDQIQN